MDGALLRQWGGILGAYAPNAASGILNQQVFPWLTGPVATDDYGNEIPHDASSLASMINSLVPHPAQSQAEQIAGTVGMLLPAGGVGAARDLVRGQTPEALLRAIGYHGSPGALNAPARAAASVEPETFYHGTAAPEFAGFDKHDLAYLSPNPEDAGVFGSDPILARGQTGTPRVLTVKAKPGEVQNVSHLVDEAIMNDDDVDEVIAEAASKARKAGARYLEFDHPSVQEGASTFPARISLYPKEDLAIHKASKGKK